MKINYYKKEKQEIKELHKSIADLTDKVTAPLWKRIAELESKIKKCKHPESEIVEGEYISTGPYSHDWDGECATPPFRVCKICGFAEQGWGCGYKVLAPNNYHIPTIKRSKAMKYVIGGIHSNGS